MLVTMNPTRGTSSPGCHSTLPITYRARCPSVDDDHGLNRSVGERCSPVPRQLQLSGGKLDQAATSCLHRAVELAEGIHHDLIDDRLNGRGIFRCRILEDAWDGENKVRGRTPRRGDALKQLTGPARPHEWLGLLPFLVALEALMRRCARRS